MWDDSTSSTRTVEQLAKDVQARNRELNKGRRKHNKLVTNRKKIRHYLREMSGLLRKYHGMANDKTTAEES